MLPHKSKILVYQSAVPVSIPLVTGDDNMHTILFLFPRWSPVFQQVMLDIRTHATSVLE